MRLAVPWNIGSRKVPAMFKSLLISSATACFHGMRQLASCPQNYIIVASHMRSGSSLLHHLLQTNRLILGAGESNRLYRNVADFRRLSLWAHANRRSLLQWHTFVADQINHTDKLHDTTLLRRPDVKTIILIREPHGTIASLVKLMSVYYGSPWNDNEVVTYYLERIKALSVLAEALSNPPGAPAFLLTYSELVNNSVASLGALQHHLGLREPFSTTYETFDYTRTRGDPSQKVQAKRILPEDSHPDYSLPIELRLRVEARYQEVLTSLRSTCRSVDGPGGDHR